MACQAVAGERGRRRAPPELPSRAMACDTARTTNAWQSASLMPARQCLSQKP